MYFLVCMVGNRECEKKYNFIEAERIYTDLLDAGCTNGEVYCLIGRLYLF